MKFTWPPSEQNGWDIQTEKQKEKNFFFPMSPQNHLLMALRIHSETSIDSIEIVLSNDKRIFLPVLLDSWVKLPYPIEFHATTAFWMYLSIPAIDATIDLAYFPWKSRVFRMRGLLDADSNLIAAYRINKNGKTIAYFPPKDDIMKLPEDTYMIPPTDLINSRSILLVSSQTSVPIKKLGEGRYFLYMKNGEPNHEQEE